LHTPKVPGLSPLPLGALDDAAKRLLSVKRPAEGWPGKPPKEVYPKTKRGGK
jgi:hypothetical protein